MIEIDWIGDVCRMVYPGLKSEKGVYAALWKPGSLRPRTRAVVFAAMDCASVEEAHEYLSKALKRLSVVRMSDN